MIFPLNTPKKKKKTQFLWHWDCVFPSWTKKHQRVDAKHRQGFIVLSHQEEHRRFLHGILFSAKECPAAFTRPGTSGTSGTTIWSPSGLNLRHYQNRPWDQATQAVNMVMGKPTINGSFTGKISYKWWFVNLSDGKKFDFLQTCLHRSAKVCHQQFLWISDPWEQDPASEPYPRRPIWAPLSVLGCPWEMWKHWIVLYRYYKLAMSQPA